MTTKFFRWIKEKFSKLVKREDSLEEWQRIEFRNPKLPSDRS